MNFGRLVLVENGGRGRARSKYNQLTFVNESGDVDQILLTDRELESARDRANKNSSDLLAVSWLDRLVAFKINVFSKLLSFVTRARE